MYPNSLIDVLTRRDHDRRRSRDEAWRAWHRQPDALPLPEEPSRSRSWRLPLAGVGLAASVAAVVSRLAAWSQLLLRR